MIKKRFINTRFEKEKIKAEINKIYSETRLIEKPYLKPMNWIPILIAIGSIFTALTQFQVSKIKEERYILEMEKKIFKHEKELELSNNKLIVINNELKIKQNKLAQIILNLNNLNINKMHNDELSTDIILEFNNLDKNIEKLNKSIDILEKVLITPI